MKCLQNFQMGEKHWSCQYEVYGTLVHVNLIDTGGSFNVPKPADKLVKMTFTMTYESFSFEKFQHYLIGYKFGIML